MSCDISEKLKKRSILFFENFLQFSRRKKLVSPIDTMRPLCGILVVFTIVVLSNRALAADKKDTKKLQIGVKKRVADCQTRSKSGDTLHMHYTVSVTRWW